MSSEKIREQFESWAVEEAKRRDYKFMGNVLKRDPSGEYSTTWVDMAWIGWEASRATLVIELPNLESWLDLDGRPNTCGEYQDALISSVEAAGLTVRP